MTSNAAAAVAGVAVGAVTFEVMRNRLVAITEEMRIALQSVSGSPTVTEASDFFTGLFLTDGSVASMGFQVAFQAPVCGAVIRHINARPELKVADGDMFIGNDPYIGALHQNDVQMLGPIYAGDRIVAWAGVQAHQTDVGGMDFASWCPKARNVYQEGMRIPCVKLVDRGELREDVLEMILTASRLPDALGLDIRAFMATVNVARSRIAELASRYGAGVLEEVMRRMIESSETKMRARLRELPDGEFHACDFLEHDGHENVLYKVDVRIEKRGERLRLDYGGSSRQAPGFINCTRAGLQGAVAGSVLPSLAWDMQWNQGALAPVEVVAPDGLLCTAQFPAPVGSATVEAIWVTSNATMLALNRMLATAPGYAYRAQGVNDGAMATFNLGGVNQYGEPFGLHLMDPLAAGASAFPAKDGVNAGGPITSPVSAIADVEKNEQASPLFYLHRRLAIDTAGAGQFRGGLAGEVALALGGIGRADALIMTHGAEMPNTQGLCGGWPGSTIRQRMGRGAVKDGRACEGRWQIFGPKPGLTPMTGEDLFAVTWQGGGGYGDPIERDIEAVAADVAGGWVSPKAARAIYGVVLRGGKPSPGASARRRRAMRVQRVGKFLEDPQRVFSGERLQAIGANLFIGRDQRGLHVVTRAGCILASGDTRWRRGAVGVTRERVPAEHGITLHRGLAVTTWYCPLSGTLLAVDVHEKGRTPEDDAVLDLDRLERVLRAGAPQPGIDTPADAAD
ncbi:MAG: hydantoinase B/oxoprolinase family protein [Burkholderiales bacterium]|nr:hydantoinase B/oxoprolinase family protein [Burkholderiales bacterium]